jgi:hypothetical protein
MSSMYKLSRVMDCVGQLSEQKLREQLLEALISEGYQFDPKYVVVSSYDEKKMSNSPFCLQLCHQSG